MQGWWLLLSNKNNRGWRFSALVPIRCLSRDRCFEGAVPFVLNVFVDMDWFSRHWQVISLGWNAPGTLLASGSADQTCRLWTPSSSGVVCGHSSMCNVWGGEGAWEFSDFDALFTHAALHARCGLLRGSGCACCGNNVLQHVDGGLNVCNAEAVAHTAR